MNEREFQNLLAADIRNELSGEERQWLHGEANLERRAEGLRQLKNDLDSQLARRKAEFLEKVAICWGRGPAGKQDYFVAKGQYERWRASVVRLKMGIENHLGEVRRKRRETQESNDTFNRSLVALIHEAQDLVERLPEAENWKRRAEAMVGISRQRRTLRKDHYE